MCMDDRWPEAGHWSILIAQHELNSLEVTKTNILNRTDYRQPAIAIAHPWELCTQVNLKERQILKASILFNSNTASMNI